MLFNTIQEKAPTRLKKKRQRCLEEDELTCSSPSLSIKSEEKTTKCFENDDFNFSITSLSANGIPKPVLRKKQTSKSFLKKSVRFDSVEIREHEITLEINPCVSSGPAVGLGWGHRDLPYRNVDQFERKRPAHRSIEDCRMSQQHREFLLLEFGYCRSEIHAAVVETIKLRHQRQLSSEALGFDKALIAKEWVLRKVKKLTKKRSRHRKEEEWLWKNAQK